MDDAALLEKTLVRLATVDDSELSSAIDRVLCRVLVLLRRPDLRKGVFKILEVVNARIKNAVDHPSLPVQALLRIYTDSKAVPALDKRLALAYIDKGLESYLRSSQNAGETWKSMFELFARISSESKLDQISILQALLLCIPVGNNMLRMENPRLPNGQRELERFRKANAPFLLEERNREIILEFLLQVILFPYPSSASNSQSDSPGMQNSTAVPIPDGLCADAVDRVTKKGKISWSTTALSKAKLAILELLKSGLFQAHEIYMHALVGSADSIDAVSESAEDIYKRFGKASLDDHPNLLEKCFTLYLGSVKADASVELLQKPANLSVKQRIVNEFCKSRNSTRKSSLTFKVLLDLLVNARTKRLKISGIQYLQWCLQEGDPTALNKVTPLLLSKILVLLKELPMDLSSRDIRGLLYEPLADLCLRAPHLINQTTQMVNFYFNRLKEESGLSERQSIRQALRTLSKAYATATEKTLNELKPSLMSMSSIPLYRSVFVSSNSEEIIYDNLVRICAMEWLNQIYPFSSIEIRFLFCTLTDDSSSEIKDLSEKFLLPRVEFSDISADKNSKLQAFPDFENFLKIFETKTMEIFQIEVSDIGGSGVPPAIFCSSLKFSKRCLSYAKMVGRLPEPDVISHFYRIILKSFDVSYMKKTSLVEVQMVASSMLLELLTTYQDVLISFVDISWIQSMISNSNYEIRTHFSHILGILMSHSLIPEDTRLRFLVELLKNLTSPEIISAIDTSLLHGTVYAVAFLNPTYFLSEKFLSLFQDICNALYLHLGHSNSLISSASCDSIGRLGESVLIPFRPENPSKSDSSETNYYGGEGTFPRFTISQIIGRLLKLAQSAKIEHDLSRKAVDALGCISIGISKQSCSFMSVSSLLMGGLFRLDSSRDEELQLAIGKAISRVCKLSFDSNYIKDDISSQESVSSWLEYCILKFTRSSIPKGSKLVRGNVSIWLLFLIKEFSEDPRLVISSEDIQTVLASCLCDSRKLNQEVAAKGLSLLYEVGDSKTKPALLRQLIQIFSTNVGKVDQSSENQKEDGDSFRSYLTYRDLSLVASDIGHPSLIYKLLDLISNHKIWTRTRASEFSFGSITTIASYLKDDVNSLVPKLFRYQYDPNKLIQKTMRSLWSVLIIDTKLQLQSTFESIIQELLREITNKSERIREACCLGIADIIKSKSLESLSLYVEDLYRNLFYVLDDISDTVRLASLQFAKSLLQVSEKMCDISSMKKEDATRAVNLILPSLLNKGLSHSAKEVRALSMEGIIRITKVAGDTLRPHLPNLIEEILVAMSSTEPMELSYAMFHSQALNVTVEQIESTRLMLANSSPLSTALDQCVNLVDDSCLDDVVQKLVEIIRVGVGFASVTSSAKVIKILVSRFPSLMKDHASKVIFALKLGLFDQSATIRKVYSECMSSICSIASENQVHSVLKMISELYLSSNSPENRRISGVLALEISKVSGDSIVSQFSKIIPLAYIASKDVDNESANLWLQMFNECSSGEASTIDKYLSDILALQLDMIASPIYDIRDTGLISLGHLSKLCKSNQEFRLQTPSILQTLLKCLEYQDWAGKHNLFETISEVIKCVPQISTSEESSIPILIKHLISDDSKEFSIKSLGKLTVSLKVILDTFPNSRVDAFLDIKNFLVSLLRVFSEKGDETNDLNRESRELMISVYECMGSLLPVKENAKYQQEFIGSILRLLMGGVLGQHYLIRASALRSIASTLHGLGAEISIPDADLEWILSSTYVSIEDSKHANVRSAGIAVMYELIDQKNLAKLHLHDIEDKIRPLGNDGSSSVVMITKKLLQKIESMRNSNADGAV